MKLDPSKRVQPPKEPKDWLKQYNDAKKAAIKQNASPSKAK